MKLVAGIESIIYALIPSLIVCATEKSWICGHVNGGANVDRIVGGWDDGYYKYPWYAALVQEDFVYCGGTLITSRHVVTAAHCYKDNIKKNDSLEEYYDVKLGVYNRCQKEKTQRRFKVERVFVHEEYVERDPFFDIALLQLKEEAKGFMPCCIPKDVIPAADRGKEAFIAGLGNLNYKAPKPPCTFHEARVKIYTDDRCRKMLDKAESIGDQLVNAMCAGYLEGNIDACQGDSGGPLMIVGKRGEHVLLGLTSFGYECAAKNVLGLYTDVSRYLDWLQKKSPIDLHGGAPGNDAATPTTKEPAATGSSSSSSSAPGAVTSASTASSAEGGDFPWNEVTTVATSGDESGTGVVPKPSGAGNSNNGPTIIIYVHKKAKHHRHHLLKRKRAKRKKDKGKDVKVKRKNVHDKKKDE